MTVTKYVVLYPFSGWAKGAMLDDLPEQFWVDKGYLAKIEVEESEAVEEHKIVGRPRGSLPSTGRSHHAEHDAT